MNYTRREFGTALLAAIPLSRALGAAAIDSVVSGVQLGVQTYSFHDVTQGGMEAVDLIVKHMTRIGLGMCELFSPDIEPFPMPWFAVEPWAPGAARGSGSAGDVNAATQKYAALAKAPETLKQREVLRNWRLSTPLSYFTAVAKKFSDAGIKIYCYNLSFDDSYTDDEIERGFEIAKALGTDIITASTNLPTAKRLVPFLEKHRMYVAIHGHSDVKNSNQFSSPATFAAGLELSKYFKVNLDIGHFWAAGFDPVAYIQQEHANITNLHLKDRLKNEGANVPWGEGPDHTPVRQVLQLLKQKQWPIPAFVEYEYQGPGTPEQEVAKCVQYSKEYIRG
jgi:sugar phosphate isomerase/epimerase